MSSVELIKMWDLDYEALYVFKSKKSGSIYCTYINYDEGYADCDCPAFIYAPKENKTCKHVKELAITFPPKKEMVLDMSSVRERFLSSSVLGVNTLIGGYIPKVPYGVYGFGASGKTIFSMQEAYALAKQMSEKQGRQVGILYYDTEGDGDILQMLWQPVFERRFGKQKFIYMGTDTDRPVSYDGKKLAETKLIEKVCKDWGLSTKVRKEGTDGKEFKGKVRFEWQGDVPSKVEETIYKENIGIVIIDSTTDPLDGFPGGTMNFPARADAIKYWMSQVHLFAKRHNLVVLTIHHASKSPSSVMSKAQMIGGTTLFYRFKVIMCLERVGDERKMRLARYFNKEEFNEEIRMKLTDDGFIDCDTVPKYSQKARSVFQEHEPLVEV